MLVLSNEVRGQKNTHTEELGEALDTWNSRSIQNTKCPLLLKD